jgi:hypothetical protein
MVRSVLEHQRKLVVGFVLAMGTEVVDTDVASP